MPAARRRPFAAVAKCRVRRPAVVALAALASFLIGTGPAPAFSWDQAREQQALRLVQQFQARHRVPLLSLSVSVDGRTVLARGLDDDGLTVLGGEDFRYRIGSVTKQFTAAGILALIDDRTVVPATGLPITMRTTLGDIFPADVNPKSAVGRITVRRLLTMTSNIPNYTDDPVELSADAAGTAPASRALTALQIIQHLKSYDLVGTPRMFAYSNTNYFVLALIIHVLNGGKREVTDIPVQTFLHQRILAKAGMTNSGLVGEPAPPGTVDAAPSYLHSPRFNQGSWPKGAGDMVSTAVDMARWNIALMAGKVISEKSVREMLTPVAPVLESGFYRGCRYAMGWYVCNKPRYRLYQHDGVISGFMASNSIGRRPDGSWIGVTVLGNIDATADIVGLVRGIVELGN